MIEDYEDEEFFEQNEEEFVDDYNSWENEPGWDSYEKYGGYNGYDDLQSTQFLKETQKLHGTLTENISNNARLLH